VEGSRSEVRGIQIRSDTVIATTLHDRVVIPSHEVAREPVGVTRG
jgi:hypothetical protein